MNIRTPLISKALKIAHIASGNSNVPGDDSYLNYFSGIAPRMDTENEFITALMYKVMEDTDMTIDELEREGLPQPVLDALQVLTCDHDSETAYYDSIGKNPLAIKVKLAYLCALCDVTVPNTHPALNKTEIYAEKFAGVLPLINSLAEQWEQKPREAESGDAKMMYWAGVVLYRAYTGPQDIKRAFKLISNALQKGLSEDFPGEYNDKDEDWTAAFFLTDILLNHDDGALATRSDQYWFEKPFEAASDIDKLFMYLTGRGGVKRDLEMAANIAHRFGLEYKSYYKDLQPAVFLRDLIGEARDKER